MGRLNSLDVESQKLRTREYRNIFSIFSKWNIVNFCVVEDKIVE